MSEELTYIMSLLSDQEGDVIRAIIAERDGLKGDLQSCNVSFGTQMDINVDLRKENVFLRVALEQVALAGADVLSSILRGIALAGLEPEYRD